MQTPTLSRRDFAATATGALALAESLAGEPLPADEATLDLAEWSYFWVGVERARWLAARSRRQADVRRVLDPERRETSLPDRAGAWRRRPGHRLDGHSRRPSRLGHHAGAERLQGLCGRPARPWTLAVSSRSSRAVSGAGQRLENISGRFTPPNPTTPNKPLPFQHFHNQWPGTGEVGSDDLDQFVASQGGSYVTVPGNNNATAVLAHTAWRERGAMLLDKIGPAVIMTHSAGGPFGWLVAEVRPSLVKGIVAIEGGGQPFGGATSGACPLSRWLTILRFRSLRTQDRYALRPRTGHSALQSAGRAGAQAEEPAGAFRSSW